MTTPSPSPPISLSPPSAGERLARCTAPPAHSSPPPVPSPLLPSSGCPTQIQTLGIASTHALIDVVTAAITITFTNTTNHLYIPHTLFTVEYLTARPTGGRGVDYGFVSTVAPMSVGEVNTIVTELAELHERDTQDLIHRMTPKRQYGFVERRPILPERLGKSLNRMSQATYQRLSGVMRDMRLEEMSDNACRV
ncbi:hypothetical protein Tco_0844412 [Tanacetum coccineum]